jgi:hypothetical protein
MRTMRQRIAHQAPLVLRANTDGVCCGIAFANVVVNALSGVDSEFKPNAFDGRRGVAESLSRTLGSKRGVIGNGPGSDCRS